MNDNELNELKMDIYKLYGKNRGKKIMSVLRRMLKLISHTEELHRVIRQLRSIGSKHLL